MKIEPLSRINLPKYAALLTAAVSAALFTGCGQDPLEISGTANDPTSSDNIAVQDAGHADANDDPDDLMLAGEESVSCPPETEIVTTDTTVDFAEPNVAGVAVTREPDDNLMTEGEAMYDEYDEYAFEQVNFESENEYAASIGEKYLPAFQEGFAKQGLHPDTASEKYFAFGSVFVVSLKLTDPDQAAVTAVCFYNSAATVDKNSLQDRIQHGFAKWFDWGAIFEEDLMNDEGTAKNHWKVLLVDVAKEDQFSAEYAEQIAKDAAI